MRVLNSVVHRNCAQVSRIGDDAFSVQANVDVRGIETTFKVEGRGH